MHRGLQNLAASRQSQLRLDRSSQSVELCGAVCGAEVQALALSVVPQLHCVSHGAEHQCLALSMVPPLRCAVRNGCHWRCPGCWKYIAQCTVHWAVSHWLCPWYQLSIVLSMELSVKLRHRKWHYLCSWSRGGRSIQILYWTVISSSTMWNTPLQIKILHLK